VKIAALSAQEIEEAAESEAESSPLQPAPMLRVPVEPLGRRVLAKIIEFFLAFSAISNSKRLFARSPEENLSALNGIRVLSMLWIILGHTVLFSANLVLNIQYVLEHVIGSWAFMLIPGAEFSVDTFFYMSGFLVAYLTLKTLDTKKTLNWGLFYFHRVWRIIPPLLMMILVVWKVAPLFGNGTLLSSWIFGPKRPKSIFCSTSRPFLGCIRSHAATVRKLVVGYPAPYVTNVISNSIFTFLTLGSNRYTKFLSGFRFYLRWLDLVPCQRYAVLLDQPSYPLLVLEEAQIWSSSSCPDDRCLFSGERNHQCSRELLCESLKSRPSVDRQNL
jgi:hypothetical protein